eukprot:TRINITY_DN7519_c0_g1_i1.p1 TRINITY_DN7519_c0_g1~~TRINITY_DN7519_c0_g1_i1.p1  ORF type:complete len:1084 (+),score=338.99 TRINITY_DN7519_c0_g1_i1:30-3254(+)
MAMAVELGAVEEVVRRLMLNDNATRSQAEGLLAGWAQQSPDDLAVFLLAVMRNQAHEKDIRLMAGTLLRPLIAVKDADSRSVWAKLRPETQTTIKVEMLKGLQGEKCRQVIAKYSDSVSDIGAALYDAGQWPDLLPFLFQCTKSPDPMHRIFSLEIMAELASLLGSNSFRRFFKPVSEILRASLTDADINIRIEGLLATSTFLQLMEQPEETLEFQQLIPAMLDCAKMGVQQANQSDCHRALEVFVDLAEHFPLFFKPNLDELITIMLTIANPGTNLEAGTRQLALEVLLTLSDERPKAMKKQPNFIVNVFRLLLFRLTNLEDDQSWYEFDEEAENTDSLRAEEDLDRFSFTFGGTTLAPLLFSLLPPYLANAANWKERYAGCMALSVCCEGCKFVLKPRAMDMLRLILPMLDDPHARVRWAALNCIGEMFSHFAPEFEAMYGSDILARIFAKIGDQALRVKAHCCTVLTNYAENCEQKDLVPHLSQILSQFTTLLGISNVYFQEVVLEALSSVAVSAKECFGQFYDHFVPYLKSILQNAKAKELRELRGKAIECLSLIGIAVGKERFLKDIREITEQMLATKLEADDPQMAYLETAFGRFAECLGSDFVPFLPIVMPAAITRASMRVSETENIGGGKEQVSLHTTEMDDKSSAMHIILVYAMHLKAAFFPYVEQVAKIYVPEMGFVFHEGIRSAACTSPPILLHCVKEYIQAAGKADAAYLVSLFVYMFGPLVAAAKEEDDLEVLAIQLNAMQESMNEVGQACMTPEQVGQLVAVLASLLEQWQERRNAREEEKEEEPNDEELDRIGEEEQYEDDVLGQLIECLGKLAEFYPGEYTQHFTQTVLPLVVKMLTPEKPWNERQKGLCIFDDIIEHAPKGAASLLAYYANPMMQYLSDEDGDVRQAAAFGIGAAAQALGDMFAPFVPEALRRLFEMIAAFVGKHNAKPVDVRATENAVSAIGKIYRFHCSRVNMAETAHLWLSQLPLSQDEVEARRCHDNFAYLLENSNLLGEDLRNAPAALQVAAKIACTPLVTLEAQAALARVVRRLAAGAPQALAALPLADVERQQLTQLMQQ